MPEKVLWKRGPWEIVKTGNGRIRVDHGMLSEYPVLYTHRHPWTVGWDSYKVPVDVRAKVKSLLIMRENRKERK